MGQYEKIIQIDKNKKGNMTMTTYVTNFFRESPIYMINFFYLISLKKEIFFRIITLMKMLTFLKLNIPKGMK